VSDGADGRAAVPEGTPAAYDLMPRYPVAGGAVEAGYGALAGDVERTRPPVLAIDGPAALPWERMVVLLGRELASKGLRVHEVDVRGHARPWPEIERRTDGGALRGDPEFASLCSTPLRDLLDLPTGGGPRPGSGGVTVAYGPGAALLPHDRLWYADLPKRLQPQAVRDGAPNLGQPPGTPGTQRRLRFIDWPVQDRHKQEWLGRFDRYVDLTDAARPRSFGGAALRRSLRDLAAGPFRTRPVFCPGAWGGQWMRRVLGAPADGPNLAWSYELITPEGGILLGDEEIVEVGFELLMAEAGRAVVGADVARRFGGSFPIRFDYLDTMDGGPLSVHCHPRDASMRDTFGWPYPQHESYYVMATLPGRTIFLGLRDDADLDSLRAAAERAEQAGIPLEVERYVRTYPARAHSLYLIPAGTPHASGEGNVVLEISATPYLYSLRLYDWLRPDLDGGLRPVHVGHAFANLDARRARAHAREPAAEPRVVRSGAGFVELELGRRPELFFAVHRLDFDDEAADDTDGRFHVLNLVESGEVLVEAAGRSHRLAYAETLVVPASVGPYRLVRRHGGPCRVIKAFVAAP